MVGDFDGTREGASVGCDRLNAFSFEGSNVGDKDGTTEGTKVGIELGVCVG
jgi:hypothetical protein